MRTLIPAILTLAGSCVNAKTPYQHPSYDYLRPSLEQAISSQLKKVADDTESPPLSYTVIDENIEHR
jgi:hypothetical protein